MASPPRLPAPARAGNVPALTAGGRPHGPCTMIDLLADAPTTSVAIAGFSAAAHALWQYLWTPLTTAAWSDLHGFWYRQILDDRFVAAWFLPLVPVLAVLRRDRLRVGIILTGLVFLVYVFGVLYAALWLGVCLGLHRLGESFARQCARPDVPPRRPIVGTWLLLGGGYVVAMAMHNLKISARLNAWLFEHACWIFPLGTGRFAWEPLYVQVGGTLPHPPQLFAALYWNVHSIGVAYLAVRMLQYFSEIRRGTLPPAQRTRLNFLAWVCYAPTLIQGPVERFAQFQAEMDTCHQRRGPLNLLRGLGRIAWGLSKSIIGTLWFQPLVIDVLGVGRRDGYYAAPENIASTGLLVYGVFFQIFWLYLEFSGYCDLAAGTARILGYRQIENFRLPWIATSLRDFWKRWHISLSEILRDYVYIPLGGNRRRGTLNLCITFAACGLWHALAAQVAAWGVLMGLMIAVNQAWAHRMKRLDASATGLLPALRRAALRLRPLPTIVAWLITQHAFLLTLLVFFGGTGGLRVLREIVRRLAGL